ncbi:MAG: serine/threonine protein kinase, partial [Clostridia bacterium]|nr:serine/threonine protein kinase [Clostridia bacterium]
MEHDELLTSILNSDANEAYPAEFKAQYDIMECLSEQQGITTFLVMDHNGNSAVAKCYDRSLWTLSDNSAILSNLDHKGLPKQIASFENDDVLITVREYAEGIPLSRYAQENELPAEEIVRICPELCDILAYLHHRDEPIIHRDIKPQNIIIGPDGSVSLIDFDIARVYRAGHETDTVFFGTLAYAPPEQYGFSQTDARTDIYSLGIVLRWLLTGSTKQNKNVRIYRPLDRIIRRCTAFAPDDRFSDVSQVKSALLAANPKAQAVRLGGIILCALLCLGLLLYGGIRLYRYLTYTPFTDDAIPGYMSDEERINDAVSYMKGKYSTSMFDEIDEIATVGDLRTAMIDLYGLDRDSVYAINEDMPQENEAYFMPWGW